MPQFLDIFEYKTYDPIDQVYYGITFLKGFGYTPFGSDRNYEWEKGATMEAVRVQVYLTEVRKTWTDGRTASYAV